MSGKKRMMEKVFVRDINLTHHYRKQDVLFKNYVSQYRSLDIHFMYTWVNISRHCLREIKPSNGIREY